MKKMKRRISPMAHLCGCSNHSASTESLGMAVCEKSYSRLLVSTWIGSIGTNGKKMLAPNTLNMLPKFEEAAILIYLMMLPKTRRPSSTPSSSTSKLFSSKMMSEDSLAISTALLTEMPTSAARSAGASLMPSPIKPTTCPFLRSTWMMCSLCSGASLAKTVVFSAALASSSSFIASISAPSKISSTGKPTCRQTVCVTRLLSPVKILTAT